MWISKKKLREMNKRIVALEVQVQELQKNKCSIDDISSSLKNVFESTNHQDNLL